MELLQDPARADHRALAVGEIPHNTRLAVPREEFYNAALHFHSRKVVDLLLEQEGKYPRLMISLVGVTLSKYMEEMYKGGRWRENNG